MPRRKPGAIAGFPALVCAFLMTLPAAIAAAPVFTAQDRIVNLGDSITDGQTYALLLAQALAEAHKPVPTFIGAGIGGETAADMAKRLDRDVLFYHPTWVMLNCGINDIDQKVTMPAFEASVNAIADRFAKEKVPLMIFTTTNVSHGHEHRKLLAANVVLRRVAQQHGLIVAEVFARMEEARLKHEHLWEKDGGHLNFEGYRMMTRAILDAMGYADVPVPTKLNPPLLPGLITNWKILNLPKGAPGLTEATAAALKPDAQWKELILPQPKPVEGWWWNQERERGVAVALDKVYGGDARLALTTIDSPAPRHVYINAGGNLHAVWLNGKQLPLENHGYHPGGNRIPVDLPAGTSTIVVEANASFSVTMTDTNMW